MNETLKAAGHIGAELGAAIAENEALREQVRALQSDANSWQSGYDKGRNDGGKHRKSEVEQLSVEVEALRAAITPQVIDWVRCGLSVNGRLVDGSHPTLEKLKAALSQQTEPSEPAPAQDEREVAAVIGFYEGEREPRLLSWNVLPNGEHRLYTRPAQTEQQPVGYQFQDREGSWKQFMDQRHYENTLASGEWPIRPIYAAPVAQTELVEALDPYAVAEQVRKALDRNACPNVYLVIAYEEVIAALANPAKESN
jgi:hypothetical protein